MKRKCNSAVNAGLKLFRHTAQNKADCTLSLIKTNYQIKLALFCNKVCNFLFKVARNNPE